MNAENKVLGVSFTLPDTPTVREQLKIDSRMALLFSVDDWYLVYFQAINHVINDWECEKVPNPKDLLVENETDPDITAIIVWTCKTVQDWRNNLGNVPKN